MLEIGDADLHLGVGVQEPGVEKAGDLEVAADLGVGIQGPGVEKTGDLEEAGDGMALFSLPTESASWPSWLFKAFLGVVRQGSAGGVA